jgi:DNA-binding Lrp family transcriptional regulator
MHRMLALMAEECMMLIMNAIDPLDARILLALDDDPEATTLALSRRLGIARNTVHARLRRVSAYALRSFAQRIDPAALGYPLVAFVSVSISQSEGAAAARGPDGAARGGRDARHHR